MATKRNPTLSRLSDEELEAELEARQAEENQPPPLVEKPDWNKLKNFVVSQVEEISKPDGYSKDFEHYVFEEVMSTLYGKGFWDWFNEGPCERCGG